MAEKLGAGWRGATVPQTLRETKLRYRAMRPHPRETGLSRYATKVLEAARAGASAAAAEEEWEQEPVRRGCDVRRRYRG